MFIGIQMLLITLWPTRNACKVFVEPEAWQIANNLKPFQAQNNVGDCQLLSCNHLSSENSQKEPFLVIDALFQGLE
jgi:hypothetical protein